MSPEIAANRGDTITNIEKARVQAREIRGPYLAPGSGGHRAVQVFVKGMVRVVVEQAYFKSNGGPNTD